MADEPTTHRVRFRFRVGKKLTIEAAKHRFKVTGREVELSGPHADVPIKDCEWLVMNARGFKSERAASSFAEGLRKSVDVASVATRLGLDSGKDRPTSALFDTARKQVEQARGVLIRNNVHGVDVFPDDPRVRIFSVSANATVTMSASPFLEDIAALFDSVGRLSENGRDTVLLLNYALMRTDPVSQIVIALSAVEALGQTETWSEGQRRLIESAANCAEQSTLCEAEERREVVDAIRRGQHKISLRQGVLRLLHSLGLSDLKKEWDKVYGERSGLVHGLAPRPEADYSSLANRTLNLCGRILLRSIAREVPLAEQRVDQFYERQRTAS